MKLKDILGYWSSVTTIYNQVVVSFKIDFQEAVDEVGEPVTLASFLEKEYDEKTYLARAKYFEEYFAVGFDYSFDEFVEAVEYFDETIYPTDWED
jgi:hypothetical protein